MKFTIVTPSLNQLEYLKRNVASVRDQEGVSCEHVIQDACSSDGTVEWMKGQEGLTWRSERDEGMYDAINRGIERGSGDVLAWLNCDEQYLPGTLQRVAAYFNAHPEIDIVFGHTVVVDESGEYMCHRKAVLPRMDLLKLVNLPVHSSSMFFRRRVVESGLLFDTKWKAIGDWDWVRRAAESGMKMGLLEAFLSSFTDTGENLDMNANSMGERKAAREMAPWMLRVGRPLVRAFEYGRKVRGGYYRQEPFDYEIFLPGDLRKRNRFEVKKPTFYWKGRMLST